MSKQYLHLGIRSKDGFERVEMATQCNSFNHGVKKIIVRGHPRIPIALDPTKNAGSNIEPMEFLMKQRSSTVTNACIGWYAYLYT